MSNIRVSKFYIRHKALDLEGNNTIHSRSALKRNHSNFLHTSYMEKPRSLTHLCPFSWIIPLLLASSKNFFSRASSPSGPPILKGTFIRLRQCGSTVALKTRKYYINLNVINYIDSFNLYKWCSRAPSYFTILA